MATSGGEMSDDNCAPRQWRDVVQGCFWVKVIWTVQLKPSGPKQMPDSLSFPQWRYFSLSKHPVPAWEMPPNREVDKALLHGAQNPHQGRDGEEEGSQWEVELWDLSLLIFQEE